MTTIHTAPDGHYNPDPAWAEGDEIRAYDSGYDDGIQHERARVIRVLRGLKAQYQASEIAQTVMRRALKEVEKGDA